MHKHKPIQEIPAENEVKYNGSVYCVSHETLHYQSMISWDASKVFNDSKDGDGYDSVTETNR